MKTLLALTLLAQEPKVTKLIQALDEEKFEVRENAEGELFKLGKSVFHSVYHSYLFDPLTLEQKKRMKRYLQQFSKGQEISQTEFRQALQENSQTFVQGPLAELLVPSVKAAKAISYNERLKKEWRQSQIYYHECQLLANQQNLLDDKVRLLRNTAKQLKVEIQKLLNIKGVLVQEGKITMSRLPSQLEIPRLLTFEPLQEGPNIIIPFDERELNLKVFPNFTTSFRGNPTQAIALEIKVKGNAIERIPTFEFTNPYFRIGISALQPKLFGMVKWGDANESEIEFSKIPDWYWDQLPDNR